VRNPAIYSKLAPIGIYPEYLPPDKLLTKMREEYKLIEEVAKRYGMIK